MTDTQLGESREVLTSAADLRGMLDGFAVDVLRICLPEREDDTLLALLASKTLHPGHVLDLLGFDAGEILQRFTERAAKTNLWQRYRLRRALHNFMRNSFVFLYEQMQFPAPDHQWYQDAINAVIGNGSGSATEWATLRQAYLTGNKALMMPELLSNSDSRFVNLGVLANILIILQHRDSVNMHFADCYRDVQPEIDKHVRDLAAVWRLLPKAG